MTHIPDQRPVPRSDAGTTFSARNEFLTFGAPLIGEEEIAEVVDTLRSGWIGFGPKSIRFEAEFAQYLGRKDWQAVSVSSCTAALHLCLVVAGIGPGDEVVTTPLTFAATANAIEMVGATPVFVDVDPVSHNMRPAALETAIGPRTRAVIPVHMAGRPCDMTEISRIAERAGLVVIEDAAHAIEARHRGRPVGMGSRFVAFSFYATKNLTTGEGGMAITSDELASARLRRLRLHGLSRDAWARYGNGAVRHYEVEEPGYKYNLTDLQASLGLHQLARLEENLTIRSRHWARYDAALDATPWLRVPAPVPPGDRHARHLYTLQVETESPLSRDALIAELHRRNVGTGVHFRPVHLHPYFQTRYGFREGAFPVAEHVGRSTLSLPLSARLTDADVDYVLAAIEDSMHQARMRRRPTSTASSTH